MLHIILAALVWFSPHGDTAPPQTVTWTDPAPCAAQPGTHLEGGQCVR